MRADAHLVNTGLRALCRGVPAAAFCHVDHEAILQEPGQGYLPHQQAQPGAAGPRLAEWGCSLKQVRG